MKLGVLLTSGCLVATACGGSIFSTSDSIGGGGSSGRDGGSGGAGGTTGHTGGAAGVGGTGGAAGSGMGGAAGSGMGGAAGSGMGGAAGAVDAGGDASPDWAACDGPGQCVAELTACCPPCSVPQLDQFAGVSSDRVDAFHTATCPVALPCAACASGPNPNIAARCNAGRCEAFDVRKVPEFSGCSGDQDCHLRSGLGCCECGGGSGWVALSATGSSALITAVCAPMSACADCLPVAPSDISAACEGGACQVKSSGKSCSLAPRMGCCFSDADCGGGGQRCYQAQCSAGYEGKCEAPGNGMACWDDGDCPSNEKCTGASICGIAGTMATACDQACFAADKPGICQ